MELYSRLFFCCQTVNILSISSRALALGKYSVIAHILWRLFSCPLIHSKLLVFANGRRIVPYHHETRLWAVFEVYSAAAVA